MRIHRNLAVLLIATAGYLGGAFLLKMVERSAHLPPDTAARALQVFNGLALAVYGNFLPKTVGNVRNPAYALCMQATLRVSGWAFTLGGLGFAVTSLLPLPFEVPIAVLSSAAAYVLGYSAWAFTVTGRRKSDPAA